MLSFPNEAPPRASQSRISQPCHSVEGFHAPQISQYLCMHLVEHLVASEERKKPFDHHKWTPSVHDTQRVVIGETSIHRPEDCLVVPRAIQQVQEVACQVVEAKTGQGAGLSDGHSTEITCGDAAPSRRPSSCSWKVPNDTTYWEVRGQNPDSWDARGCNSTRNRSPLWCHGTKGCGAERSPFISGLAPTASNGGRLHIARCWLHPPWFPGPVDHQVRLWG